MIYKKKDGELPEVSNAASVMGKIGGASRNSKKLEAAKKRIHKGGRPPVYHFNDTGLALMVGHMKNIVGQLGQPFQKAADNVLYRLYDNVSSMPGLREDRRLNFAGRRLHQPAGKGDPGEKAGEIPVLWKKGSSCRRFGALPGCLLRRLLVPDRQRASHGHSQAIRPGQYQGHPAAEIRLQIHPGESGFRPEGQRQYLVCRKDKSGGHGSDR